MTGARPDVVRQIVDASLDVVHGAEDGARKKVQTCMFAAMQEAARSAADPGHRRTAVALAGPPGPVMSLVSPPGSSAEGAAAGHAFLMHANLRDDAYRTAFHPGQLVVPTALAAGEEHRCSGDRVLAAVWFGYELACRLADLLLPTASDRGWRITAVLAPLASAATAAHLLADDGEVVASAARLAAATAGGPLHTVGAGRDWAVQPALSVPAGLAAARLAVAGYRAEPGVCEARFGLVSAFTGGALDPGGAWAEPGPRVTNVRFKRYDAPMYAQQLLAAVDDVVGMAAGRIRRITAKVSPFSSRYAGAGQAPGSVGNVASTVLRHLRSAPGASGASGAFAGELPDDVVEVRYDEALTSLEARVEAECADGTLLRSNGDDADDGDLAALVKRCSSTRGESSAALARAVTALADAPSVRGILEAWQSSTDDWQRAVSGEPATSLEEARP